MTSSYYKLIKKLILDLNIKQLIIMGDVRQCIYEYNGTDSRYLTHYNVLWSQFDMIELSLSTSYRLTNQVSNFINRVMLNSHLINTIKDGPGVVYIIESSMFISTS